MPSNIHARYGSRVAPALAAALVTLAPSPRPRPTPPPPLALVSRTRGERFEVLAGRAWQPFLIRGVNLGAALPGRFPSEFPEDSALYAGWLDTIASLRANTVRVYTLLPPAFYRAFRAWNVTHPARPLWLVHGVWAELPPRNDFEDVVWRGEFRAEARRVVNAVHGTGTVAPRPGHAAGRYDADVSRWTLAFIMGREWEPYAVKAFDAAHPKPGTYAGEYLVLATGTAMDAWVTAECDWMLRYEATRYRAIRPIAYTNWPTLDPLTHPSEASAREEAIWWERAGHRVETPALEYENDAVSLDAMLVRPTAANPAGWFASYHAYPYYPDFVLHEYAGARSSEGPSSYFGYLRALQRHHAGMPLVIAEYGVPSSRGNAHQQPEGWSHGGHDEAAQGAIDARLTREIGEAGAAGAIVFAWMDEWFKRNWAVTDFEIPAENNRLWHSAMDAEQHYGLLGQYAGTAAGTPVLGGNPEQWRRGAVNAALHVGADEAYVYVAVDLPPGEPAPFDWASSGVEIGIDTYLPREGQHRLPRSGVTSALGFEFVAEFAGPDSAALRVLPEYNRYAPLEATSRAPGAFYRRPVTIADRSDGRFEAMWMTTNRARFGRDGTFYPAAGYDRGLLRHGREAESTLSDWYYDPSARLLELRLPWDLLNVTDPSSRTLLYERTAGPGFGTVKADSFHFAVTIYPKAVTGNVGKRPRARVVVDRAGWTWAGWTEPVSHARLKPAADSMKAVWSRQ